MARAGIERPDSCSSVPPTTSHPCHISLTMPATLSKDVSSLVQHNEFVEKQQYERWCWFCEQSCRSKLLFCGQCRCACYCSEWCQVKDWKFRHKQECGTLDKSRRGSAWTLDQLHNTILEAMGEGNDRTLVMRPRTARSQIL